jgi:multimeric flavodoxin WrbA
MARLLVVHHSPSRSMGGLVEGLLAGARDPEIEGVEVRDVPALEATAEDVLGADGYLLATPANFGYMSGALKHFFDSTFLAVGGSLSDDGAPSDAGGGTSGRPFGLLVHGRYDTTGAVRSVLSIVGGLGWRQAAEVLEVLGEVEDTDREAAYELGATLAALLST